MSFLSTSESLNCITTNASPFTNVTQNYTLMAWVYIDTTSEKGEVIYIGKDENDSPTGGGMGLALGSGNGSTLGNEIIGECYAISWIDVNANAGTGWHHFCMTDGSGTQTIYLDGISKGTTTTPVTSGDNNKVIIGENAIPAAGVVLTADNRVAHCKAWTKALTLAQVQIEMNSTFPVFGYTDGTLAFFWPVEKSGGAGNRNQGIDFTQKFTSTGTSSANTLFADNPPVARC